MLEFSFVVKAQRLMHVIHDGDEQIFHFLGKEIVLVKLGLDV